MGFWPGEDYTIRVKGSAEEALRLVSANTVPGEPIPKRRRGDNITAFVGVVRTDGFSLAHYYNIDISERWLSFLLFSGRVIEDQGKTIISVRFSLITHYKVMFSLLMALCGVIIAAVLATHWGEPFDYGLLVPMIIAIYAYGLMRLGFRSAARQTREILDELFSNWKTGAATSAP